MGKDGFRRTLATLFGFTVPVSRRLYLAVGVALLLLKYAGEWLIVRMGTGRPWPVTTFLSPLLSVRERALGGADTVVLVALGLWTLPFLWIGVAMSVRRAADARLPTVTGLLFLVPWLNWVLMLVLVLLPSRRPAPAPDDPRWPPMVSTTVTSALAGTAAGLGYGALVFLLGVYVFRTYGTAIFVGTPVLMGTLSAYVLNRGHPARLSTTLGVATLSVFIAALALLAFAAEGFLCLAMAAPLAVGGALLGACVGRVLALGRPVRPSGGMAALFVLPLWAGVESVPRPAPLHAVVTVIEVRAPPERVWANVIGFSDIDLPPGWFFRTGLAFPLRARIEGSGVGAVRHCEFSTGAFVEPITVWDPPHHLGFDVSAQPPPMTEWSPYRHVHPPHLDASFRSVRGEFRLVGLPGGRTRLEGTTWYQLRMEPALYWTPWADAVVHAIHRRVLDHVARLSER